MIKPEDLEADLRSTLNEMQAHGKATWQRVKDWTRPERVSADSNRGGGLGEGRSDDQLENHRLDAQASAYHAELDKLSKRLNSDLRRLRRIIAIANPPQPISADAGCDSCARDGGYHEPVWAGRYRSACRACAEWKTSHGEWPPLRVVRWWHRHPGKKVPVSIVERAS